MPRFMMGGIAKLVFRYGFLQLRPSASLPTVLLVESAM
jgi:hypothetical protein